VKILEDAACAAGGAHANASAGAMGDMAVFSFHPRKSITTGEGGMVTTNDHDLAGRVQVLRNHGASVSEEERHHGPQPYLLPAFEVLGYNYRMTDLQGAIGLVQLRKLDRYIDERARWASWYAEQLSHLEWLRLPQAPESGRHAWQAFVTYVDPQKSPMPRNDMMAILHSKGIATRPGTHAVHMLKYYAERFNLRPDDYPGAWSCDRNTMAIPLHNKMTPDDFAYVVNALRGLE
jgi:dTDP-4-amino-4,6-dideoxygalactose transaminase